MMDHEPLLSSEETDALLAAVRASGASEEPARAELASTDRPLREALGRAQKAAATIARTGPKVLLRTASAPANGEEIAPEIIAYSQLSAELEPGATFISLKTKDSGAQALFMMGPVLTGFILSRRMGASLPQSPEEVPLRLRLTPMDQRLLAPVVNSLIESFSDAWSGAKDSFGVSQYIVDATDKPEMNDFEAVLRIALRIQLFNGPADTCWLALTVPAVMESAPREVKVVRQQPPEERLRMAERLGATEVEAVAVLGRATTTIRRVIDLHVGDVIRLDNVPEDPVNVLVEGVTVLRGAPVVHKGNLSVEVIEHV